MGDVSKAKFRRTLRVCDAFRFSDTPTGIMDRTLVGAKGLLVCRAVRVSPAERPQQRVSMKPRVVLRRHVLFPSVRCNANTHIITYFGSQAPSSLWRR